MAWSVMCANALADIAKNTMSAPPKLLIAFAIAYLASFVATSETASDIGSFTTQTASS